MKRVNKNTLGPRATPKTRMTIEMILKLMNETFSLHEIYFV